MKINDLMADMNPEGHEKDISIWNRVGIGELT